MFKRNSLSNKSRKSPAAESPAANPLPAKSAIKSLLQGTIPPLSAAPLGFHHGKQPRPPLNPTTDDLGSDGSGSQASTSSNPSMQSSPARVSAGRPAAPADASSFGSDDQMSAVNAALTPSSPGPQTRTIDAGRETLGWAPPIVLGASSTPHNPLASSTSSLDTYSTAVEAIPDPAATPRPLAIKRPSLADVPLIFSPRLTTVASSTSSFLPTPPSRVNSLNLDFDPLASSPVSYSGPSFANGGPASDGLPPPMTPARPGVQSRKSSVSALPRRTPQPMPIANLPTLPPLTPASQPEDPMRTIRSMPRVLMTPSATPGVNGARQRSSGYFPGPETADEEDDDGGEAGDGDSESDSDEEALTAERSSDDEPEPGSGTTSAGSGRRASVSSISVDSINEESDDEEAHQMGSLPLDDVTLNDIPRRRNLAATPSPPLPLSDRRNVTQRPRLPPLATSSATAQAGGTASDRFVGLDWSLPTPSTEPAFAPEGAWATFSCPTPGGFTPVSAGPPRPFAAAARAKTPSVAEKTRTPRAQGGEGAVSSYFEVVPESAPEGGKTPQARTPAGLTMSTRGKERQVDLAGTTAAAAAAPAVETASMAIPNQPSPSLGLGPTIEVPLTSKSVVTDDGSDSDTDGDSGDSHDASPDVSPSGAGGADESFVMLAPPTPGARVPTASQEAFRPSLYHQASRSLINLSGPSDRRLDSNDLASSRDRLRGTMGRLELPPPSTGQIAAPRPLPAAARPSALPPMTSPKASSAVALTSPKVPSSPPPPMSPAVETRRVRRRNSMSDVQRPPPDYSPPGPGSSIPRPRDEEGKEKLPSYTCNVHIEGYLPRKTEFTAPGVQARDRAWKRQYFVLHGTCLKVYKHDIRRHPVRGSDGKEYTGEAIAQVAQGAPHVHFPGVPAPEVRPPIVLASDPAARRASDASRRSSDASNRRPSTSVPSRAPSEPPASNGSRRGSVVDTSVRSVSGSSASVVPTSAVSRTSSSEASLSSSAASYTTSSSSVPETVKMRFDEGEGVVRVPRSSSVSSGSNHPGPKEAIAAHLPFHGSNQLVKAYTLQNAESGLAADYVKKKNVVRVRLQGEQFLIETGSPKEVVDWIEAFQAATNVALDLDERPMPKIITLPRRRRRRRPDAEAVPAAAAAAGAVVGDDDSAEANIRAAAAADPSALGPPGGGRQSAAVDSMERMLGEDQGHGASTV